MIDVIEGKGSARHEALKSVMHRDRKKVFVDRLGWDVPHDGESEADSFDDEHAVYLVLRDPASSAHLASIRILRTDRPHLLDTVFPHLCAGPIPRGPAVREISRYCVMPYGSGRDRRAARNALADAALDYFLGEGVRQLTVVCYTEMLSEVLSAGADCRPLGLPQDVDGKLAGALAVDIGPNTKSLLARDWRLAGARVRSRVLQELAA